MKMCIEVNWSKTHTWDHTRISDYMNNSFMFLTRNNYMETHWLKLFFRKKNTQSECSLLSFIILLIFRKTLVEEDTAEDFIRDKEMGFHDDGLSRKYEIMINLPIIWKETVGTSSNSSNPKRLIFIRSNYICRLWGIRKENEDIIIVVMNQGKYYQLFIFAWFVTVLTSSFFFLFPDYN